MKLSAEEIEKRIEEIAYHRFAGSQFHQSGGKADIRKLIEDATGEKIPETGLHLSVWGDGSSARVVIHQDFGSDRFIGTYCGGGNNAGAYYGGGTGDFHEMSGDAMRRRLRDYKFIYLGQYNFSAGLPEGAK